MRVDSAKVKALCDRYLNAVVRKDIRYVPFLNVVLVTFARMQGYVNDDRGRRLGQLPEGDMVYWIPTIAFRAWLGVPIPSHLALFPYRLYVDSAYGLSAGREALGLFKNFATFEGGEDPSKPVFRMNVLGFDRADPERVGGMLPLVHTSPCAPCAHGQGRFEDAGAFVREGFRALRGDLCATGSSTPGRHIEPSLAARAVEFAVGLVQPQMKVVSLKQFRDVSDPLRACLQQVVEVETTVNGLEDGGFLTETYDMHFHAVVTDTLVRDLGIELEDGVQRGVFGFWARATFTMGSGVVVR